MERKEEKMLSSINDDSDVSLYHLLLLFSKFFSGEKKLLRKFFWNNFCLENGIFPLQRSLWNVWRRKKNIGRQNECACMWEMERVLVENSKKNFAFEKQETKKKRISHTEHRNETQKQNWNIAGQFFLVIQRLFGCLFVVVLTLSNWMMIFFFKWKLIKLKILF